MTRRKSRAGAAFPSLDKEGAGGGWTSPVRQVYKERQPCRGDILIARRMAGLSLDVLHLAAGVHLKAYRYVFFIIYFDDACDLFLINVSIWERI